MYLDGHRGLNVNKIFVCVVTMIMTHCVFLSLDCSNTIVFGSSLDLSRNVALLYKPMVVGISLVFDAVNEKGGVRGLQLVFHPLDDEYNPVKTRANIERLNHDKIDMILSSGGTKPNQSLLDLVEDGKILVMFPMTYASIFRKRNLKYFKIGRAHV